MALGEWLRPPRHLLLMFFGITAISAASLGWLSWQLVSQDRDLASKRAEEARDNAAGLAVAALQKHLSETEEQLTGLANLPDGEAHQKATEYSKGLSPDSVLVVIQPEAMEAYPSGRLLYYPFLPPAEPAPIQIFAEADVLEYQQKDDARAIPIVAAIAKSANPGIRARALVRLASSLRRLGRWQEALRVYDELATLGSVPAAPPGIPAELVARAGLALAARTAPATIGPGA